MDMKIDKLSHAGSGDAVILSLNFASSEDAAACSLEFPASWDALTNLRSRILPITDGSSIRTTIWLDRGEGFVQPVPASRIVRLNIESSEPITISNVSADFVKDNKMGPLL